MLSVVREDKDGTGEICTELLDVEVQFTCSEQPRGEGSIGVGQIIVAVKMNKDEVGSICKFPLSTGEDFIVGAAVGVEIGI